MMKTCGMILVGLLFSTSTFAQSQITTNDVGEIVTMTKGAEGNLTVEKTKSTSTVQRYTLQYLRQQKRDIIADREAYIAARNAEIAIVQQLIDQAKTLGVE